MFIIQMRSPSLIIFNILGHNELLPVPLIARPYHDWWHCTYPVIRFLTVVFFLLVTPLAGYYQITQSYLIG